MRKEVAEGMQSLRKEVAEGIRQELHRELTVGVQQVIQEAMQTRLGEHKQVAACKDAVTATEKEDVMKKDKMMDSVQPRKTEKAVQEEKKVKTVTVAETHAEEKTSEQQQLRCAMEEIKALRELLNEERQKSRPQPPAESTGKEQMSVSKRETKASAKEEKPELTCRKKEIEASVSAPLCDLDDGHKGAAEAKQKQISKSEKPVTVSECRQKVKVANYDGKGHGRTSEHILKCARSLTTGL